LALAVPLSRFTSRVGGGSAFYVRPLRAMNDKTKSVSPAFKGWTFVICSIFSSICCFQFAGSYFYEAPIPFFAFPGVVMFVVMASICSLCFVLCPRKPAIPKIVTFIFIFIAIYFALDAALYYHVNIEEMGWKVK
jgi:hypothetical protein